MSAGTTFPIDAANMIRPLLHDLRSPLASIMALANFASSRRPMRQDQVLSALADISVAARHLNDLAEIALFVNKAEDERSGVDIEAVSFNLLIDSLFSELAPQATGFGIELCMEECSSLLHADPALLKMLFRFLIKSAIKYSRSGDKVTVTSCMVERSTELRHEASVAFTLPDVKGTHSGSESEGGGTTAFRGDGFFQLNLTILFGSAVADSHRGEFFVIREAQKATLVFSIPAPPAM